MNYGFPKPEHLCLRADIERLFSAGSLSLSVYPLRATYREVAHGGHGPKVQVLLSVSKRKFRHAVDRNRAKRQLREAYRLQKHILIDSLPSGKGLHIAFVWLSDKPRTSVKVHAAMKTLLHRIEERCR